MFAGGDNVPPGLHQDPCGGAEGGGDAPRAPRHRVPRCSRHIHTHTGILFI